MPSSAPYGLYEAYDGRSTIQLGFELESDDGSVFPFSEYDIRFYVGTWCHFSFEAAAGAGLTVDPIAGQIGVVIPARRLRCGQHSIELVFREIATGTISVLVDGEILIDGDY